MLISAKFLGSLKLHFSRIFIFKKRTVPQKKIKVPFHIQHLKDLMQLLLYFAFPCTELFYPCGRMKQS